MSDFAWTRKVPPGWQKDLDALNPGKNVSRMVLTWQAGWPWRPVQRFEAYEVLPGSAVEKILRQEELLGVTDSLVRMLWNAVRGPNPRTIGTWKRDPSVPQHMGGVRWKSSSMVSEAQWRLHQQTGGLPMRSWIIEGDQGGHAWQFGQFEQHFLLASGAEPEDVEALVQAWPDPGDLPYADYDQRVFNALAERNALNDWRESLRWDERSGVNAADILDKETKKRHRDMKERMYAFISHQVSGIVNDIPRKLLPAMSDVTSDGPVIDADAETENLLNED